VIDSYFQAFSLNGDSNIWENISVSGLLTSDAAVIEAHVFFNNPGLSAGTKGFMDNAVLTVTAPPSAVPEPSSSIMLFSALFSLVAMRRAKSV
jgi:hypothetical protein